MGLNWKLKNVALAMAAGIAAVGGMAQGAVLSAGTGSDGPLVVASSVAVDATRTTIGGNVAAGSTTITVASASGFAAGDELLVVNMQGTGAGMYEFAPAPSPSWLAVC